MTWSSWQASSGRGTCAWLGVELDLLCFCGVAESDRRAKVSYGVDASAVTLSLQFGWCSEMLLLGVKHR